MTCGRRAKRLRRSTPMRSTRVATPASRLSSSSSSAVPSHLLTPPAPGAPSLAKCVALLGAVCGLAEVCLTPCMCWLSFAGLPPAGVRQCGRSTRLPYDTQEVPVCALRARLCPCTGLRRPGDGPGQVQGGPRVRAVGIHQFGSVHAVRVSGGVVSGLAGPGSFLFLVAATASRLFLFLAAPLP